MARAPRIRSALIASSFRGPLPPALVLAAIVALGTALRFWRLSAKPIWLDEAMSMLLAAGRGPDTVPLGVPFPLAYVNDVFSAHVNAGWRAVVALLRDARVQHTHPPLFYLAAHAVLSLDWASSLTWTVRAVAAGFGVAGIPIVYSAAREAFDDTTARIAATLAAVSPWGVMLAQEARNYTLPLACAALSLWAAIAIARRLHERGPVEWRWWALWSAASVLGFYAHYNAVLISIAEAAVLADLMRRGRSSAGAIGLAVAGTCTALALAPWLPTLWMHVTSKEQQWMMFAHASDVPMTVYETLSTWQTMFFGLAWSVSSGRVEAASRMFALVAGLWALTVLAVGWWQAERDARDRFMIRVLTAVFAIVLVEFAVAMLLTRKNLVAGSRYHFVYYPAFVLIAARTLSKLPAQWPSSWSLKIVRPSRRFGLTAVCAVGLFNAVLVGAGIEDWKTAKPARVAAQLNVPAREPIVIVAGVGSFHEAVAELGQFFEFTRRADSEPRTIVLVSRSHEYAAAESHGDPAIFANNLAHVKFPASPETLWVHVSGMRDAEYNVPLAVGGDGGDAKTCVRVRQPDDGNVRGAGGPEVDESEPSLIVAPRFRRYSCGGLTPELARRSR